MVVEDVKLDMVPHHVDPALVVDFDHVNPPGMEGGDVYAALSRLHDGPDIVWTPHHGGHWIATRAEDIKWIQESWSLFSAQEKGVPRGRMPMMPPITYAPPRSHPLPRSFQSLFRQTPDRGQFSATGARGNRRPDRCFTT